ncbi:hypothetical protein HY991_01915 [Candidatus Micrarchaeota archaeon]|nr:hypothetical protein [Candidatus Micrarchaeota archaeon]
MSMETKLLSYILFQQFHSAEKIAKQKKISLEEMVTATTRNELAFVSP